MKKRQAYQDLIHDAEWRIGSFISSGGNSEDQYVKDQIQIIRALTDALSTLEQEAKFRFSDKNKHQVAKRWAIEWTLKT